MVMNQAHLSSVVPQRCCPHCDGSGKVYDDAVLGATLRIARQASGLSQHAVARRMGIDASFVSRLEAGKRVWTVQLARAYANALGDPYLVPSGAEILDSK